MTQQNTNLAFQARPGETNEAAGKRLFEEVLASSSRGYKDSKTGVLYAPGTMLIGVGEVQEDGSLKPFPGMYEMLRPAQPDLALDPADAVAAAGHGPYQGYRGAGESLGHAPDTEVSGKGTERRDGTLRPSPIER